MVSIVQPFRATIRSRSSRTTKQRQGLLLAAVLLLVAFQASFIPGLQCLRLRSSVPQKPPSVGSIVGFPSELSLRSVDASEIGCMRSWLQNNRIPECALGPTRPRAIVRAIEAVEDISEGMYNPQKITVYLLPHKYIRLMFIMINDERESRCYFIRRRHELCTQTPNCPLSIRWGTR